jgi:16S rRNA (uracil1498-N3)-methyltransferase
MHSERFFIEEPPTGETARLSAEEARHLRDVRRLAVGDVVDLFDGSGTDYEARVTECGRRGVSVEIVASRPGLPEPGTAMTLGVAVVKSQPMGQLIDMSTQLGVRRIVPIQTERSVVEPRAGKLDRWRRIAITACKQSGRSVLPEIEAARSFGDLLAEVSDFDLAVIAVTRPGAEPLSAVVGPEVKTVLCLIGPEGGFTEEEAAAALAAGCRAVSLGQAILRTETAAAAALAVIGQAAIT